MRENSLPSAPTPKMIEALRELAVQYLEIGHHSSAIFWTEKLLSLTPRPSGDSDRVLYVRSLLADRQPQRALSFLKTELGTLTSEHLVFRYFAALALFQSRKFDEAAVLLDAACKETAPTGRVPPPRVVLSEGSQEEVLTLTEIQERLKVPSSCCVLLARCFLELENRERAAALLKRCLQGPSLITISLVLRDEVMVPKEDPYCVEALDILLKEHLIPREKLETELKFPSHSEDSEGLPEMAKFLYTSMMHSEAGSSKRSGEESGWGLVCGSRGVRVWEAECLYYKGHYGKAWEMTEGVLREEDFYWDAIPLHVALLLELRKKPALFLLAHNLVDSFPDHPISWYAVGAYYFLLGNQDSAKKFLVKMTGMRPTYGPGWLLLGHSFAAEQEHDQAINCYLKATKLLSGCHFPLMYIGVEYGLSHNLTLSEKFLNEAARLAPQDPFILNELGVLASKNGNYGKAVAYYFKALDQVLMDSHSPPRQDPSGMSASELERRLEGCIPGVWEPLLTNLGGAFLHSDPGKAVVCRKRALHLSPEDSRLMGNLGVAYLADLRLEEGIDWLQRSLSIQSETVFSTLMSEAMEKLSLDNSGMRVLDSEKDNVYFFHPVPVFGTEDIFKVPKLQKRKRINGSGRDSTIQEESSTASPSLSGIEIDMETSS